jgi:hypothetical protein
MMKQMTKEKQDKQGLPIMLILTLPQPFAWLGKSHAPNDRDIRRRSLRRGCSVQFTGAWASKQGYEYSHYMQNVLH